MIECCQECEEVLDECTCNICNNCGGSQDGTEHDYCNDCQCCNSCECEYCYECDKLMDGTECDCIEIPYCDKCEFESIYCECNEGEE